MSSKAITAEERNLKIKASTVKRLAKDITVYKEEARRQQERIENLETSGADIHDVRKQQEVLQETLVMIPDTKRRLEGAFAELEGLLATATHLKESDEFSAAAAVVDAVRPQLAPEYE
ncbi:tubulin binding cofactor A [Blastocladiella britannica]|nr:tubulin binding cofactor A [Blastocladiella britannica]